MAGNQLIGIIGGMGTLASQFLFQRIVELANAKSDQEYPEFIFYNCPKTPDRTGSILNKKTKIVEFIATALNRLERAGSKRLILDCNTAYFYYPQITKRVNAKLLNLVDENCKRLIKERVGAKKIGILATTGTLKTKLYETALKKHGDFKFVYPNQSELMKLIYGKNGIKTGNLNQHSKAAKIINDLLKKGAECILVGCTDLSILINEKNASCPIIDSTTTIAKIVTENRVN